MFIVRNTKHYKNMPKGQSEYIQSGQRYHDCTRRDYLKKEVYNALANGATYSNIYTMLQEDHWDVGWKPSRNTCYDILKQVKDQIKEDWKEDRKYLKEQIYANILDLYNESRQVGDRRIALDSMKEIAKLGGLYDPEKIEIQGQINSNIEIDFGFDEN